MQDERRTGAGTEVDEDDLGDIGVPAGDAANHALTETGGEAGPEEHDVRDAAAELNALLATPGTLSLVPARKRAVEPAASVSQSSAVA